MDHVETSPDARSDLRAPTSRRPARVEPLAVLPVFLALKGKPALVVGGSDAASWKAELLDAAGAAVEVRAEALGEAMTALVSEGRVAYSRAPWREADLSAFAVAIADLEGAEAAAFAAAARAAGVPVNVIDQPALCTFQFGTIVNRSPVVVGISTDGAAPVLGQAIRRRIETLRVLPPPKPAGEDDAEAAGSAADSG